MFENRCWHLCRARSQFHLLAEVQGRQGHRHQRGSLFCAGTAGRRHCAGCVDCCVRIEPLRVGGFHRGSGGIAHGGLVDTEQPDPANRHHRAGAARHLQTQGQHPASAQRHGTTFWPEIRDTGGNEMKITVLGAGAWGTALAKVLHENGNAVTLWDIDTRTLDELRHGRNERYLPDMALPTDWKAEADFAKAVAGAECLAMAIPSQAFRQVAMKLKGHPAILVSVTKGIEFETGETMSRILREHAQASHVAALS